MAVTLYDFTVPPLMRGLSILSVYMDRAAAHAGKNGTDVDALIDARLAPDMMPLSSQVQRASDKSKNGVARLAGIDAPALADTERTFDELKARIARTRDFIATVTPARFEGAEDREIELRFKDVSVTMNGHDYLTKVLLPDFYFHIATTHGILRENGLDVGKADYIGKLD